MKIADGYWNYKYNYIIQYKIRIMLTCSRDVSGCMALYARENIKISATRFDISQLGIIL